MPLQTGSPQGGWNAAGCTVGSSIYLTGVSKYLLLSLRIITLYRELWEGLFKIFLPLIILYFDSLRTDLIKLIYLNISHNNTSFRVGKITIKTPHNKLIRAIHTNSKGPSYIWVYDLTKLSDNDNCLVKGAPFNSLFLITINGIFYSTNASKSIRKYENVYKQKLQILKENKGKSGIYLFRNLNNKKISIGS